MDRDTLILADDKERLKCVDAAYLYVLDKSGKTKEGVRASGIVIGLIVGCGTMACLVFAAGLI